jgi:hypothetical protein
LRFFFFFFAAGARSARGISSFVAPRRLFGHDFYTDPFARAHVMHGHFSTALWEFASRSLVDLLMKQLIKQELGSHWNGRGV